MFEISADGLIRCQNARRPNHGCIPAHGGLTTYGDGLIVATGSNIILEIEETGAIKQGFDTWLKNTHLMEFAVDVGGRRLYAIGSCAQVGEFSGVDLKTAGRSIKGGDIYHVAGGSDRPLVFTGEPCGEMLVVANETSLVAAQLSSVVPSLGPGSLLFIDAKTGKITRKIKTPAEPVDILVVSSH